MATDEIVDHLTRYSPQLPDQATLFKALAALAAGVLITVILGRFRKKTGSARIWRRQALDTLGIATFVGCGLFVFTHLCPMLLEKPRSFSREVFTSGKEFPFERFLRDAQAGLPEKTGILLINCRDMRQAEWANYFLYPRTTILRSYSYVSVDDPRKFLSGEAVEQLRSIGVEWVLDLKPEAWNKGTDAALISLDFP